jgi:hypothetical protein
VDSPYYTESELCGGAVTAYFSKYLPWQAMHFLQRSIHFSKKCCRPLVTSKFLPLELPFHGRKSPEIAWGKIWTVWRMEGIVKEAVESVLHSGRMKDVFSMQASHSNPEGRREGSL